MITLIREREYSFLTSSYLCISPSILKVEMTMCMIRNCYSRCEGFSDPVQLGSRKFPHTLPTFSQKAQDSELRSECVGVKKTMSSLEVFG